MTKVSSTHGSRTTESSDRASRDGEPRPGEFDDFLTDRSSAPASHETRYEPVHRRPDRSSAKDHEAPSDQEEKGSSDRPTKRPDRPVAKRRPLLAAPPLPTLVNGRKPTKGKTATKDTDKDKSTAQEPGKAKPKDTGKTTLGADHAASSVGRDAAAAALRKKPGRKQDDEADPTIAGALAGRPEGLQMSSRVDTPQPVDGPRLDAGEIREIAQKILSGIQIRQAGDRTDIQMRLELGRLGGAQVRLTRGDEGKLSIAFQLESLEGQQAVASGLQDLKDSLQARGLKVAEIQVRTGEGPTFSDKPQDQPGQQDRSRDDERQRRRQQDAMPEEPEEK